MVAHLMAHLPLQIFRQCVAKYPKHYQTLTFSHLDQFLCLAFEQPIYRESLRNMETYFHAHQTRLYHLGIRGNIAKATLARKLYTQGNFAVELGKIVCALDATTVNLCLGVLPWAHFRHAKEVVKMHTLLDLSSNIPTFIHISDGKMCEINVLDILITEAGSFHIMDRSFVDFACWFTLHQTQTFIVIRGKSSLF